MKRRYFKKYDANNDNRAENNAAAPPTASPATTPQKGRNNQVKLTRAENIAFVARTMAGLWEWIDSLDGAAPVAGDGGGGAPMANRAGDGGRNGGEDANGIGNIRSRVEEGTFLVLPLCKAFLHRCLYEMIEGKNPGLVLECADSIANGGGAAGATARDQIRAIRLNPMEKEQKEAQLRWEA
jgi:hypothetical protein